MELSRQHSPSECVQFKFIPLISISCIFLPFRWEEERSACILAKHLHLGFQTWIKFLCVCFPGYPEYSMISIGQKPSFGQNGENGFRCFCQDQYFSTMFIYKLFNLLWHSQWRKERSVPICWCKLAILGVDTERPRPWRNLWKGERSLPSVFFLCPEL